MSELVTVCIPAYNAEVYITQAIESIAAQSYRPIEIIVVNDGSTDDTVEVARKAFDAYGVKGEVYTIENRGAESARDYGLSKANGVYIAPLDSDDLWEPEYLSTMLKVMDSNENVGLSYSDFINFFENNNKEEKKSDSVKWLKSIRKKKLENNIYLFSSEDFFPCILQGQVIFPSCSVYRKTFYEEIGAYSKSLVLDISTDWEFALRAVRKSPIIYIDKPLLMKRTHEHNVSGDNEKTTQSDINVLHYILENYTFTDHERDVATRRMSLRNYHMGYISFEKGHLQEARKWFYDSMHYSFNKKSLLYFLLTLMPAGIISSLRNIKQKMS